MTIPDLLTVGEAFEDLIFFDLPRLPRPGEELKTDRFERTVGGGAVITAVAAVRLGLRCSVWSGLGPPAVQLLTREGISFRNLLHEGEEHAVSVALSTAADRSFVTFNGVNDVLEQRLFEAATEPVARHVHFAFYPRECERWAGLIERYRQQKITTSWDFGWNESLVEDPHFVPLVGRLDYFFVNSDEALLYSRCRSFGDAVEYWRERATNAIIKLGHKGCRWVSRKRDLSSPAQSVAVVDTTGAGDAFNAGFLYGLAKSMSPERCLGFANTVAALSTRAAGGIGGLPHRDELE